MFSLFLYFITESGLSTPSGQFEAIETRSCDESVALIHEDQQMAQSTFEKEEFIPNMTLNDSKNAPTNCNPTDCLKCNVI